MPTVLRSEMSMLVQPNPRALLVRLLLAVCLVACLVWVALCLLLVPIFMYVRRGQRKAVA
jgi:hypothetical protein